jgi:mono/diheme cytochrome c family protein
MSHNRRFLIALGFGVAVCASACAAEPFGVYPSQVHTGYTDDPDVHYEVPLEANDSSATFELQGDCCTLEVEPGTGRATVKTVKAGTGTVIASIAGEQVEVPIDVVAYTAGDIVEGREVYTEIGCAGCHSVDPDLPDLSGVGMAENADAIILRAIRTGINAEGKTIPVTHMVNVPDGLVAWVRSLAPRTLPE